MGPFTTTSQRDLVLMIKAILIGSIQGSKCVLIFNGLEQHFTPVLDMQNFTDILWRVLVALCLTIQQVNWVFSSYLPDGISEPPQNIFFGKVHLQKKQI